MLSNPNAMILMTDFEKAGGGQGGGDQKRFLELPRTEARQLKMFSKEILVFIDHLVRKLNEMRLKY